MAYCMAGISLKDFFARNQFAGYFLLKSPLTPSPLLKSQMVGP